MGASLCPMLWGDASTQLRAIDADLLNEKMEAIKTQTNLQREICNKNQERLQQARTAYLRAKASNADKTELAVKLAAVKSANSSYQSSMKGLGDLAKDEMTLQAVIDERCVADRQKMLVSIHKDIAGLLIAARDVHADRQEDKEAALQEIENDTAVRNAQDDGDDVEALIPEAEEQLALLRQEKFPRAPRGTLQEDAVELPRHSDEELRQAALLAE